MLGVVWALVAAFFFGSQFATFKIAKRKPSAAQYQLMTAVGTFLLAIIMVPIFKLNYAINLAGIVGGFLWATGNFLATKAVEKAGLSKTMPIWAGLVVLVSSVVGIMFFHEAFHIIYVAIFGSVAIIFGIFLVSKGYEDIKQKAASLGIRFAIIAGIIFGFVLVPLKLANLTVNDFFFPMSVGILITGVIIFLLHRERITSIAVMNGIMGGIIWNIGNLSSIFAVAILGYAVGPPMTQLAAVVSVLWGVFAFKEIKERRKKVYVFLGAIIVILGAAALAFSK